MKKSFGSWLTLIVAFLASRARVDTFFRKDLHSCCDGGRLHHCSSIPSTSVWLMKGSSFMSRSDSISTIHVHYNCLFNKSRAARCHSADKLYARGCRILETLNLISQQCFSTHRLRILWHNSIQATSLAALGSENTVYNEPIFHEPTGRRLKPGIMTYNIGHQCWGHQWLIWSTDRP